MIGNYTAWEIWINQNIPLVMMLAVLCFSLLLWGAKSHLRQQNELNKQKKLLAESEMSKMVAQIERLVDAITELFDDTKSLKARVGTLEKETAEHMSTCGEREKMLKDMKDLQKFSINKFDNAILNLDKD